MSNDENNQRHLTSFKPDVYYISSHTLIKHRVGKIFIRCPHSRILQMRSRGCAPRADGRNGGCCHHGARQSDDQCIPDDHGCKSYGNLCQCVHLTGASLPRCRLLQQSRKSRKLPIVLSSFCLPLNCFVTKTSFAKDNRTGLFIANAERLQIVFKIILERSDASRKLFTLNFDQTEK